MLILLCPPLMFRSVHRMVLTTATQSSRVFLHIADSGFSQSWTQLIYFSSKLDSVTPLLRQRHHLGASSSSLLSSWVK